MSGVVYLSLSFQDPDAPSWIGGLRTMSLLGGVRWSWRVDLALLGEDKCAAGCW